MIALALVLTVGFVNDLQAQDPILGEIKMFAGNFAPRGYAFCDGQLLPIAQNSALYSILGTTYGGDGRTTFALPDLRGRAPVHQGSGPGLNTIKLGQKLNAAKAEPKSSSNDSYVESRSIIAVNYIIALQGIFPSRN